MSKAAEYVVYDTTDNDLIVFVGNVKEVARFLNKSVAIIYCNVTRKTLAEYKYLIERLN